MKFNDAVRTGINILLIATLVGVAACAEDPSKHPDENAVSKRQVRINKELDSAQEFYLEGVNLQVTLSSVTSSGLAVVQRIRARQRLEDARSIYKSVLRRDDLEKYEGSYSRFEIEKIVQEIEGRIRELQETETPIDNSPISTDSPPSTQFDAGDETASSDPAPAPVPVDESDLKIPQ